MPTRRRSLPYRDGTIFAIPLRDVDGFGLGIVAANDQRGGVYGYFFPWRFPSVPGRSELPALTPSASGLRFMFGDLGLLDGRWPVIGEHDEFEIDEWPIARFQARGRGGQLTAHRYDRSDLMRPAEASPVDRATWEQLDIHRLSGAGAAEKKVTRDVLASR